MKLQFDERGNLKPYRRNEIELNQFKEIFVDQFSEESSRNEIFKNLKKYIDDFEEEIGYSFKLWINGSFVSNKTNPGDVDIVILINRENAQEKEQILKERFLNKKSLANYKIDAYIVRTVAGDHEEYSKTLSDLLYWEHWFSNTKKNRAKKRFPKGFIELSFDLNN